MLTAAALLKDRLSAALGEPIRSPSEEQLELIASLSDQSRRGDPKPSTRASADALIRLYLARQTLEYLRAFKPCAGDIAYRFGFRDRVSRGEPVEADRLRIIRSIGADGTVYFAGAGAGRAPIRDLEILHRADDHDEQANIAREQALEWQRRHADSQPGANEFSAAKMRQLSDWLVRERSITARDIDALRGEIETAADEKPIQRFLEGRPHLLTALLGGSHGRWLRSQVDFGGRHVGDFAIADADSTGIRWLLIELESPRAPIFGAAGQFLKEARKAQDQIATWRRYIAQNPDLARRPYKEGGLGLLDIEAGAPGLILISRRTLIADKEQWRRRELEIGGVQMHTYDWLLERLESTALMRSQDLD